jgi:hypothetical protein
MKLGKDKVAHIMICMLGTLGCSMLTAPWIAAVGFFLLFTIIKEVVYDLILKKGQFDWLDIVANAVGCGLGYWIYGLTGGQL